MKYVLDSSVATKWFLREVGTDQALALRDDYRKGIHELIAPDVFPVEVAHALTRAERQGRLLPPEATTLLLDLLRALPVLFPSIPLLPQATHISSQVQIGIYDCLYVALLEQEQCELITADDRLVRTFPKHRIVSLANLP
jgi:predicted nucleic acid-binding protein